MYTRIFSLSLFLHILLHLWLSRICSLSIVEERTKSNGRILVAGGCKNRLHIETRNFQVIHLSPPAISCFELLIQCPCINKYTFSLLKSKSWARQFCSFMSLYCLFAYLYNIQCVFFFVCCQRLWAHSVILYNIDADAIVLKCSMFSCCLRMRVRVLVRSP